MTSPAEQLHNPGPSNVEGTPEFASPQELRNQWLDERLNPEGTLPYVSITSDGMVFDGGEPGVTMKSYNAYDDSFDHVGNFYLTSASDPGEPGRTVAHMSWLETTKPGHGYGKAMYLGVLKDLPDAATLASDKSLSPDSYRMWKWLESKGVAARTEGEIIFPDPSDKTGSITNGRGTAMFRATVPDSRAFQLGAVV